MKIKDNLFVSAIFLAVLATFFVFFIKTGSNGKDSPNPYEYDIKELSKDSYDGGSYREEAPVEFGEHELRCLDFGPDGRLICAGVNILLAYSQEAKIPSQIPVAGTANAIHVDEQGYIYVAFRNKVEILKPDFSKDKELDIFTEKTFITSIAEANGTIFIADAEMKKVYCIDEKGKIINTIDGKTKEDNTGFVVPSPCFDVIAGGDDGKIWVVNPGRHKVMEFKYNGEFVSEWGKDSIDAEGFCGCCNPTHIAIMKDASFVTSEKGIPRVKTYSQDGTFMAIVAGIGNFDEGTQILDIAVDSGGRIFVVDPSRRKIRSFVKK